MINTTIAQKITKIMRIIGALSIAGSTAFLSHRAIFHLGMDARAPLEVDAIFISFSSGGGVLQYARENINTGILR